VAGQYRVTYRQTPGVDLDELVREAKAESKELSVKRYTEEAAARLEMSRVLKVLHPELGWDADRIARRLGLFSQ
jgi:hypothetical protein